MRDTVEQRLGKLINLERSKLESYKDMLQHSQQAHDYKRCIELEALIDEKQEHIDNIAKCLRG